jgi:hypothetical protein
MQNPVDPTVAEMVGLLDGNLREMFEERAAIREHDAGMTKAHAEALALLDVLDRYPDALSSVTVFQVDVDGDPHFFVTTSEELARMHIEKVGGTERAVRDVTFIVNHEFGGLARIIAAA